jgi:catechol 2,3-dioxygenase-like lactoylglutathione lyase family enzyme
MKVQIGVRDRERSRRFYEQAVGCLDGFELVELETVTPPGDDNLQEGPRHAAFRVDDADATAERLRAAGAEFTLEPFDAVGGVRIAFFRDPDGTLLEIVQGQADYHRVASEELVARERAALPGPGDAPRFDHVAVTVGDLDAALAELRLPVIGQLFHEDEQGFTITYLQDGDAVLELFSFDVATSPAGGGTSIRYEVERSG